MTEPLTARVKELEAKEKKASKDIVNLKQNSQLVKKDIHAIKDDVHDIKKRVEDDKKVTDMNTKEIKKANEIHASSLLLQQQTNELFKDTVNTINITITKITTMWATFKSITKTTFKVFAWLIGTTIAALGVYLKFWG